MPAPSIRPAADPLDDIDRESGGVDTVMARQDRADLPGERSDQPRGDIYTDAARELSERSLDPRQDALDAEREIERVPDGAPELDFTADGIEAAAPARGADDDDPIDETERAGDDSL
jgi:hypothetical protein